MSSGGGLHSSAQLSQNANYIIAPSDCNLKLFSSATGVLVGSAEAHKALITCVAINPKDNSQVYTASKDGTIKLWDYVTLECIRTLPVREAVHDMVFSAELPIAYLAIDLRDGTSGRVITYNLDKAKAGRTAMKTSRARPLVCSGASVGASTAHTFVATFDKHSLFVWRVGEEIYQPLNLHHTKPYTCACISADEALIAAGDATGRIQIWRGFATHVPTIKQDSQHPHRHHAEGLRPTTLHWHASAVGCLTFSPDGTYLLSGGREGVLVIWQVENSRQNFLPRLGGPLTSIRPSPADPAKYLISQADNTLRLVNLATMKVDASVLGVRPLPAGLTPAAAAAATALQPGTGRLLLPVENGELQLWDSTRGQHVSIVKVVPRNMVAMPDRGVGGGPAAPPPQPYVAHAAFTAGGSCLVTVDVRPGSSGTYYQPEHCLRFWDAGSATTGTSTSGSDGGPFMLNTRVDDPHGGGPVYSLCCHPAGDVAVTTGGGGPGGGEAEFRVWERVATARRPGGKALNPSSWRLRSRGGYKGLPLTASAFSPDGSALAIATGPKVTLWDPLACRLATVLSLAPEHQAAGGTYSSISKLAFVSGSPFLVGASEGVLAVWNLLTASLHWALEMPSGALAADPAGAGGFAVAVPLPAARPQQPLQQQQQPAAAPARGAAAAAEPAAAPAEPAAAAVAAADGSPTTSGGPAKPSLPSPPQPASHVLVFDPRSPAPRHQCVVPGTLAPALLYVQPGMPQYVGSAEGSPLLVVAESRSYQYILPQGTTLPGQPQAGPPTGEEQQQAGSSFEAVFGSLQATGDAAAAGMDLDVDPSVPRWKQLFDAPSHALPAPTVLANAFLRLINAE